MTTTNALTVIDRSTGELIDIKQASTQRLAEFHEKVDELIAELKDGQLMANRELVERLDRNLSWTERVGDPEDGVQYEIKAPSPDAGTTSYPVARLEPELQALLARKVISEVGAKKALSRLLVVSLDVPFLADVDHLAEVLDADVKFTLGKDDVVAEVIKVEIVRSAKASGVKALAKIDGTAAAIKRASDTVSAIDRKAKVTAKTKAGA